MFENYMHYPLLSRMSKTKSYPLAPFRVFLLAPFSNQITIPGNRKLSSESEDHQNSIMSIQLSFLHSYMATVPSTFSCHHSSRTSPLISQPCLSRHKFSSSSHNVNGIHCSKRLFVFAAPQPPFLKNFNLGFNKNSKREDSASDLKGASIISSERSNPLWFATPRRQDPATVFVSGATGQFGARISQILLRDGFTVRAGVTDLEFAQNLAQFGTLYKIVAAKDAKRLNAVEFEFNNIESIAKAIGNAPKAVVSIGPTEDGPTSEVTTKDAFSIIEAAKLANVKHMVVVYESERASENILEGISSFINNLFGKSEISLSKLIDKIVELDLSYTILKASSPDDFATNSDSNIVLRAEGKADVNNKISKAQVASVVAEIFANTSISENKTIEVATSPSAPLKPIGELLSAIPTDGRKEAFAEAQAKAKAEEEARIAAENERRAKVLATQLETEAKRLAEQEAKANELAAQVKTQAGIASIDSFVSKAKDFGIDIFGAKPGTQLITATSNSTPQKNLETVFATLKGGINSSNSPSQKNVEARLTTKKKGLKPAGLEKNEDVPADSQGREVRKILGGLFQQETVYVDDE